MTPAPIRSAIFTSIASQIAASLLSVSSSYPPCILSAYDLRCFKSGAESMTQLIVSRFCMARCGSLLPMLLPLLPAAKAGLDKKCAWRVVGRLWPGDPPSPPMHAPRSLRFLPDDGFPLSENPRSACAGQRRFDGSCGPPLRHPSLRWQTRAALPGDGLVTCSIGQRAGRGG